MAPTSSQFSVPYHVLNPPLLASSNVLPCDGAGITRQMLDMYHDAAMSQVRRIKQGHCDEMNVSGAAAAEAAAAAGIEGIPQKSEEEAGCVSDEAIISGRGTAEDNGAHPSEAPGPSLGLGTPLPTPSAPFRDTAYVVPLDEANEPSGLSPAAAAPAAAAAAAPAGIKRKHEGEGSGGGADWVETKVPKLEPGVKSEVNG